MGLPPWAYVIKRFIMAIYCHSVVITVAILFYNIEKQIYHGMAVNYDRKTFYTIDPWSQCYKTFIYCHSTVTPSSCVIKQNYDSNYCEMAVSNTTVIYHGISTLSITGIFITLAVNYCSIWTLEKVGFFTAAIYHGKLMQYFYNTWGLCYKTIYRGNRLPR